MTGFFFNRARLFALSAAILSSLGVLITPEANALTFKATVYPSPLFMQYETDSFSFGNLEIQYTLADGIFDTILSSPINTFFTDNYPDPEFGPEPTQNLILVPEVVTEFQGAGLQFLRSIFGITEAGLFLQILNPYTIPVYQNIFSSTIQAPEGMPLSVCKIQVCEGTSYYGIKGIYVGSRSFQTPVTESQSVPEPSAAVALGVVSALLLNRQRKTSNAQSVAIADNP